MRYIWMILFVMMLAGIGLAYLFTDIIDYFLPRRPQTEIIVESPDNSK